MDVPKAEGTLKNEIPIVYSDIYNISFMKLEKLHGFDCGKYGGIFIRLKDYFKHSNNPELKDIRFMKPYEVTLEELQEVHTKEYLRSLKHSVNVAKIIEIFILAMIPNCYVDSKLLTKFRYQVGGTVVAANAALKHGWAINLGGGFHHAHRRTGGGFCVYADITLAIRNIQKLHQDWKFLIVDLDAHQGNGHERDFKDDENVYILDMYNKNIYPQDYLARGGIDKNIQLKSHTKDDVYLQLLNRALDESFEEYKPNFVLYNAGTDCLIGDPLGNLDITEKGVKSRDEMVFKKAKEEKCPIVMVTSGGYQKSNANIIAASIWQMMTRGIIGINSHDFST